MYKFSINAYVCTDVGCVRSNNEDNYNLCGHIRSDVNVGVSSYKVKTFDKKILMSVCDGMGGESFGEVASLIAVKNFSRAGCDNFIKTATNDVLFINRSVCEAGEKAGASRIGSTLANLYIDKGKAISCNLGDSRVYLYRKKELKRLSKDHDEATRLVDMGIISPEQAVTDKRRHSLTQFLGMFEDEIIPEPYFCDEISIEDGDRFFICSDGICDILSDEDICSILNVENMPQTAVDKLIEQALEKGSKDNCTALVADIKKLHPLFYELF